jgi:hypothetical protein
VPRAGPRGRTIEESFQAGKTLTGLDQHQVRRWISWQRWTILAMLAYAFLAVITATERAENPTPQGVSLIALTCNESPHNFFSAVQIVRRTAPTSRPFGPLRGRATPEP